MYAIFRSGGHQYRAAEGETVEVERLAAAEGEQVTFDEVLLVSGHDVVVGQPLVASATVRGTVVGEVRGDKLTVFKYKRKNRYRIKSGHRQRYTRVRIDAIGA